MLLNGDAVRSSWNMWSRGCTFKDPSHLWLESPNRLPGSLQDCASRQEIQGSLKQVQKLLSAHETSYLQSLRNLKKKINLMQSSAAKQAARATNSKEKPGSSALSWLVPINYSVLLFLQAPAQSWKHPRMGGNWASHRALATKSTSSVILVMSWWALRPGSVRRAWPGAASRRLAEVSGHHLRLPLKVILPPRRSKSPMNDLVPVVSPPPAKMTA